MDTHYANLYSMMYMNPVTTGVTYDSTGRGGPIRTAFPNTSPPDEILSHGSSMGSSESGGSTSGSSPIDRYDSTFFSREEDGPDLFAFPADLDNDPSVTADPYQWFKFREFPIDPKLYTMMAADVVDTKKVADALPKPVLRYDPKMFATPVKRKSASRSASADGEREDGADGEEDDEDDEDDSGSESDSAWDWGDGSASGGGEGEESLTKAILDAKRELARYDAPVRDPRAQGSRPARGAPSPLSDEQKQVCPPVAQDGY